jgi:hypothetical protein
VEGADYVGFKGDMQKSYVKQVVHKKIHRLEHNVCA